jgi:hypothetical protein
LNLLSYEAFAMMMTQAAHDLSPDQEEGQGGDSEAKWEDEKESYSNENHLNHLADLLAMGFPEELSRAVLENCPNKPLHDLVALLSDMQEVPQRQ